MTVGVVDHDAIRRRLVVSALIDAGFPARECELDARVPGDVDLVVLRDENEWRPTTTALGSYPLRVLGRRVPVLILPADDEAPVDAVSLATVASGVVSHSVGTADRGNTAVVTAPRHRLLVAGDLWIREQAHVAQRNGHTLDLTRREFRLLTILAQYANIVMSREALLDRVWGDEPVTPNTIEVHVSSLRRKLEAHGPRMIFTVRRVGYVLRTMSEEVESHRRRLTDRDEPARDRDAPRSRRDDGVEQRRYIHRWSRRPPDPS